MSVLPRVLAGPLVRRIEPRAASFFIVTSEKARVRAHLWQGATLLAGPGPAQSAAGSALASGEFVETRRFGNQLWVALVTVHLEVGAGVVLQPSTVYSYNIELDFGAGGVTDLAGEGLLRDEVAADRLDTSLSATTRVSCPPSSPCRRRLASYAWLTPPVAKPTAPVTTRSPGSTT
jgi:hypothetical protein